MKRFLLSLFVVFVSVAAWAQVSVTNGSPSFVIDFSNTTPTTVGSNPSTAYTAAGFEPNPTTAGRLNSNAWATTGWSDGSLSFGGTQTIASTDYTRGTTAVAVTTGGFYSYTGLPGSASNPTFMIQPGASDWTPGTLTLRIKNNGTTTITQLNVSYNIYINNDQSRANSFNFSYSTDDVIYTPVSALDYTSPAAADALGWVLVGSAPSRTTSITGLSVAVGAYIYIRWSGADVSGAGSRDEFGLDDINATATFTSASTDYYRSVATGNWASPSTWESSPDNITWVAATLAPDSTANAITIRSGNTVTLAATANADQLTILSGGTLNHTNGVAFTLNNRGAGFDMAIAGGGTYVLNGTEPLGTGTVDVINAALVRVDNDAAPSESDDFASGGSNGTVTFETGSVYQWNTTVRPSWSGRIYFTSGNNATFRFSQTPSPSPGGINPTFIYGVLEANAVLTITGAGAKHFTNGIIGTANIDASGSGTVYIDGTTAVLGGGTLTLPATALQIGTGTIASMTSSKIITGDVSFVGASKIIITNYNLTVSGSIGGYAPNAYVQTDGTGYLKMNAVSGTRVFPVGYTNLNAVYINNGGGSDYSVRVENGFNPSAGLFTNYGINRTWNIFASTNTSGVELTFWYYTADANPGVSTQPQPMEVLLYSGGAWSITPNNQNLNPGGSNPWTVTTNTPTGNLTIGTTATPYIVAKSGGWILPIDCVISTRAQKRNNTGIISWTVNSCAQVNSFEVQRSVNNSGFQTIGTVNPVVTQTEFSFTDASLAKGANLYRIKVNRVWGSVKYSNTVVLIHNSNDILISSLVPNPVHNNAMLTVSAGRNAVVDFKIYNAAGNLVKQWSSAVTEGNNTIEVNAAGLPAGMYTVFVSSNGSSTVSRFVKQ